MGAGKKQKTRRKKNTHTKKRSERNSNNTIYFILLLLLLKYKSEKISLSLSPWFSVRRFIGFPVDGILERGGDEDLDKLYPVRELKNLR